MIEVKNLFKRYGAFEALKGIDFDVGAGESVGLLGENGAGKTTTMRILACFIPPTSGTVKLAGHEVVFESKAVRREIGYLPEAVPLYGPMRVEEFLRYRARLKGVAGGAALKEAVDSALGRVDLLGRRRSLIETLSKGLKQRVGLADALVHDPKILILDEPTSGLDPSQRRDVRDLIGSLKGRHTVLVSSHILPEIEATCDRAIVIHGGSVAARSSIAALKDGRKIDRFDLRLRGDAARLRLMLGEESGLRLVGEPGEIDGEVLLRLEAEDRQNARPKLARRLVEAGFELLEMKSSADGFEQAFLELIGKDREEKE